MITALAIMIAVAGYLNFAGTKIGEQDFMSMDGSDSGLTYEISDEDDMLAISLKDEAENTLSDYAGDSQDIYSLDTDDAALTENYLSTGMEANEGMNAANDDADSAAGVSADTGTGHGVLSANADAEAAGGNLTADGDAAEPEVPGEAVFTSATGLTDMGATSLAGAKLVKEQTRAQNRASLMEIINNEELTEAAKQEAVNSMIQLTETAQKESDAQMLLEAKGYAQTVVSISDGYADVMIGAESLTDAQTAQIIDIVGRKTGIPAENIIITISNNGK